MVNRPRIKGTMAEGAVVSYLQANGFPYAERRSLNGSFDRGDITGTPGLAWEVKYANFGLQLASWLTETGVERLNAGADHGILVVKPNGLGEKNVHSWYAVMTAADFATLTAQVNSKAHEAALNDQFLFVVDGEPSYYTATSLRHQLHAGTKPGRLGTNEVLALMLRPPRTKDRPEAWYRVLTLEHMVRLVRMAGYGDPEHVRVDERHTPARGNDQSQTAGQEVGDPARQ